MVREKMNKIKQVIDDISEQLGDGDQIAAKEQVIEEKEVKKGRHSKLIEEIKKLKPFEKLKVWVENPVEPLKEIKVTNFPKQQPFPKEIEVKEPKWYQTAKIVEPVIGAIGGLAKGIGGLTNKTFRVKVESSGDPNEAIPVRLSDGSKFYNAVMSAISSVGSVFPFMNSAGAKIEALIDDTTRAVGRVDFSHHELHEGYAFKSDSVDLEMNAAAVLMIAFKTPNTTTWAHMILEASFRAAGKIELQEGATWTQGTGTQLPIYNRNRNSSISSVILEDTTGAFAATDNVLVKPAGFVAGTIIHDFYIFGDKKLGGKARDSEEIVLKQNTTYVVLATAIDGTNSVHVILNWYEHQNE